MREEERRGEDSKQWEEVMSARELSMLSEVRSAVARTPALPASMHSHTMHIRCPSTSRHTRRSLMISVLCFSLAQSIAVFPV